MPHSHDNHYNTHITEKTIPVPRKAPPPSCCSCRVISATASTIHPLNSAPIPTTTAALTTTVATTTAAAPTATTSTAETNAPISANSNSNANSAYIDHVLTTAPVLHHQDGAYLREQLLHDDDSSPGTTAMSKHPNTHMHASDDVPRVQMGGEVGVSAPIKRSGVTKEKKLKADGRCDYRCLNCISSTNVVCSQHLRHPR
jgi:hypothetical protein